MSLLDDAGSDCFDPPKEGPKATPPKTGLGLRTRKLSDIMAKPIEWLWPTRYARGYLTGIFGDGGVGKSTFDLMVAACLSTGKAMPFETATRPPGTCVVMSLEDDAATTIKPRFVAAGGDPERLIIIDSVYDRRTDKPVRQVELDQDLELLRQTLKDLDAVHFTISPVSAYLGRTRNSWKDSDVRAIIDPLHAMAASLNISGTLISHPNKSTSQRAAYRMSGSQAFRNAFRIVLLAAEDPDDPAPPKDKRVIIVGEKWNISAPALPLAYHRLAEVYTIDGHAITTVRLDFDLDQDLDAQHYTPDFLLAATGAAEGTTEIEEARAFLTQILGTAREEVPAVTVLAEAKNLGISKRTLERARKALKVRATKTDGVWVNWISPKDHPTNRARRRQA